MKHRINNRFSLSSDRYNWILLDKKNGKKIKRSYFSNINQLSQFIGELVAKESISKSNVELGEIHSILPSYASVINKISLKLESYIESIIKDGGNNKSP